jgi:ATP-dependent helicase/DNAse subunit B
LLILDGFFDFTPIQGAILRELIPRIPETLVNLNHDSRNPEIFKPFQETIDQLNAISAFETFQSLEQQEASGVLAPLRERLFNPEIEEQADEAVDESDESNAEHLQQSDIRYFECGDRATEIQTIARETKRLVLRENFNLADIALVVRQRASYAETIARVMHEERLPCNLEFRVEALDVPATRAALKLFEILERPQTKEEPAFRVSDLADLIKSEYFRLSEDELAKLSATFNDDYCSLLTDDGSVPDEETAIRLKRRYRIGAWDAIPLRTHSLTWEANFLLKHGSIAPTSSSGNFRNRRQPKNS